MMTIQEYENLTGITVADSEKNRVKAVIRRSEARLGSLLGYSLSKPKYWTELGKVGYDGLIPLPSLPVSDKVKDSLRPSDTPIGKIQIFNLDELDTHIRINPAREVYRAKVVMPVSEDEFITVYELNNGTPYLNTAGLVVAITRYSEWYTWAWWNSLLWGDKASLMLAVEADYVDVCDASKYEDLSYLLTDMVSYYADPSYSLMGNIRSESIDSHSYSRASTGTTPDSSAPEGQPAAKRIIEKYAGPGAFRKLVR